MSEFAKQFASHIDFEDLAVVVDVFRRIRIGHVHHRPWSLRDADGARRADVEELRLEVAVGVEHLDAPVACVSNVDEALRVYRDAARLAELTVRGPGLSPRSNELPVLVELRHAVVVAESVGDVDVAGGVPRDIGRTIEHVLLTTGSRRTSAAAATAAFRVAPATTCTTCTARAGATGLRCSAAACATTTGRCGWRRAASGHVFGFGLAAEEHHEATLGIELHNGVRHLVNDPDVVLRINLDLLGKQHCVGGLANLADVLSGLVEPEHPRPAVRERARGAERQRRMSGPRIDEHVAL